MKTDERQMQAFLSEQPYIGLKSRTKGMITPDGKARVFFCCHPADFDTCFLQITDEIFSVHRDCAVWYRENQQPVFEEQFENLKFELRDMQLVVFPVTEAFLEEENFAREQILPYVKDRNIPILPVLYREELAKEFDRLCGNFQCLIRMESDVTGVIFRRTLEKFLKRTLCNDAVLKRIRAVWDFKIFLSYRKKDRVYAKELMRLIHSSKYCRDAAIWYDEYLTPGEEYNREIEEKIKSCDMFMMIVTPNILEEGNYVRKIEFPIAKEAGTYMCAVEIVPTDHETFAAEYEMHPEKFLTTRNKAEFKKALDDIVVDMIARKEGMTGESYQQLNESAGEMWNALSAHPGEDEMMRLFDHMEKLSGVSKRIPGKDKKTRYETYLLGLAYLNGIDVEVDQERGIALIRKAANKGEVEASRKLVDLYLYGEGVEQDRGTAERLQKKSVGYWEQRVDKKTSQDNVMIWIDEMIRLAKMYETAGKDDEAETLYLEAAYALEEQKSCFEEAAWLLKKAEIDNKLAYSTMKTDSKKINEFEESLRIYRKMIEGHVQLEQEQYSEMWLMYARIAKSCLPDNGEEAVKYLEEGICLMEQALKDFCPEVWNVIQSGVKRADALERDGFAESLTRYHGLLCLNLANAYMNLRVNGIDTGMLELNFLKKGVADYELTGMEVENTWRYEQITLLDSYTRLAEICHRSSQEEMAVRNIRIGMEIGEMLICDHISIPEFYFLVSSYETYASVSGDMETAGQKINAVLDASFGKDPIYGNQLREILNGRLKKIERADIKKSEMRQ